MSQKIQNVNIIKKTFNSTVDGLKIARSNNSYLNNQSIGIRDVSKPLLNICVEFTKIT